MMVRVIAIDIYSLSHYDVCMYVCMYVWVGAVMQDMNQQHDDHSCTRHVIIMLNGWCMDDHHGA